MKLSIITICLNDLDGLKKTISSVSAQLFSDFEHIIVDGGSSDGTIDFIKTRSSDTFRYISEKDKGIYNAMNKGIHLAMGEFCLFLNSGDCLVNSQILNSVFSGNPQAEILYGNMIIETNDGKGRIGKMPEKLSFNHMINDTLWHPVSFIRRSLFEKFGLYDENLKMVADYDFFLKTIVVEKVTTAYFDFPIAVFKLNGFSSKPENRNLLLEERLIVQKKYFSEQKLQFAWRVIRFRNSILGRLLGKLGWKL